ncbi:Alpha-D-kanosaminyltransferase [Anaerolineae bacterium]|nr:Alpha-D-kanosaminyltransferase [Anaerolineae bacterium]
MHVWNWDARIAPHAQHVITVTDIIPILYADLFPPEFVRATKAGLNFAQQHANKIIAISQFTKQELVAKANLPAEKIAVIYPGVRAFFQPSQNSAVLGTVRQRYGIGDHPYLLSVGYLDPRKNVRGHVRAFEQVASNQIGRDLMLLLVGPESAASSQVLAQIQSAQVRDRIRVTGYVPDDDIVALMNGASAFLYCSLYEGFGIPVLEAMACGTPVVTSNTTSLGEIAGDAAECVDPENFDAIAAAIERVLTDSERRQVLCARGFNRVKEFTWARCTQEHLQVYRRCAQ